jgi:snapalysin
MRTFTKIGIPLVAAALLAAGLTSSITGASAAEKPSSVSPSIVGGRPVTENYPLASVGGCTGVLVAPRLILTAAHCSELFQYRVGSVHTGSGGTVVDGGAWGLRHPTADIALFPFSQRVSTPVMPLAKIAPAIGQPTRIVGWGLTCPNPGCGEMPELANELDTSLVADSKCTNTQLPIKNAIESCVKNPGGKNGACYGDSGGPMLKKVNGVWAIVGITSRPGDDTGVCGAAPAIYTDTTAPAVHDWLVSTIAANS